MEHKIQEKTGHKTTLQRWVEAKLGELVFYPKCKEKPQEIFKQRKRLRSEVSPKRSGLQMKCWANPGSE